MGEDELDRIYEVLNKAMSLFQSEGNRYNYRSTIVRIIEEYGKWKGFTNGDGTVKSEVESINDNPDERQRLESLIVHYKRNRSVGTEREISEIVSKIDPNFTFPKEPAERKEKILAFIEEKLGAC